MQYANQRRTEITYIFAVLMAVFFLSQILGCSAVPYQVKHKISGQKKMQAAYHWNLLAEDISLQIYYSLHDNGLQEKFCFVKSSDDSPFGVLFDKLLISHLINNGIKVKNIKEDKSIVIDYSARILTHSNRFAEKYPLKYTTLGVGINVARNVADWSFSQVLALGIGVGALADLALDSGNISNNEVLVFTNITLDNRIYFQRSDIYYINDPDWWHYGNLQQAYSNKSKTYEIINE